MAVESMVALQKRAELVANGARPRAVERTWLIPWMFTQPAKPRIVEARAISRVRDLYRCTKVSQMLFDLAVRTALNLGSWVSSAGVGVVRGFLAFHESRAKFRASARMRPPIHVSEAQARRDLSLMLAEGRVRWEE